ncbi:MAG: hypothetical protein ABIR78_13155 [Ferruginibacter sp.]
MDNDQFEIIEKYLEDFKTNFEQLDTRSIKENISAIWEELNKQNEVLQKIYKVLAENNRN